jgi:hypothetical protein
MRKKLFRITDFQAELIRTCSDEWQCTEDAVVGAMIQLGLLDVTKVKRLLREKGILRTG